MKHMVENPEHYDRMIALIMLHNTYHPGDAGWAEGVVDTCIRGAIANGADYATGCCMALCSQRTDKVRLFLEPLSNTGI
jgi:hypothetical protein